MAFLHSGYDRMWRKGSCPIPQGMDRDAFIADGLTYPATLRNLELIGEAATHIPDEVREAYPKIPWRAIVGTRNRLAHGYLGIRDDVIWTIIQDAVPKLLPELHYLLNTINEDSLLKETKGNTFVTLRCLSSPSPLAPSLRLLRSFAAIHLLFATAILFRRCAGSSEALFEILCAFVPLASANSSLAHLAPPPQFPRISQ